MAQVSVTFEPGDTVQMAPPPPPPPVAEPVMTVLAVGNVNLVTGTSVECEWYLNGKRHTGWFKAEDLHLVTPVVPPKT